MKGWSQVLRNRGVAPTPGHESLIGGRAVGPSWKPLPAERAAVPVARVDVARLEHAIRCASDEAPPEQAIRQIDSLWQVIDALANLAESRMRILLARVQGPKLEREPGWLSKAIKEVLKTESRELGAPNRAAVDSASRLVRAVLAVHPTRQADLEPAPAGSVLVKWRGSSLRWLVSAPRLPWPGASVRMYVRTDPTLPKMQVDTSHYAPTVLEHAAKNL
jgi:hypothetical protein